MSSTSSVMALTKDVAPLVAQGLQEELSWSAEAPSHGRNESITPLCIEALKRTQLSFRKKKHVNAKLTVAGKAILAQEVGDQAEAAEISSIFCLVHEGFVQLSASDMDHTVSFKDITERQTRFLKMLNIVGNQTFSDEFLQQPGINRLFGRPASAPFEVQGSREFYTICYNNLSNLWLICHACNIEKSDGGLLEWFMQHKSFGSGFIAQLERDGGLHRGIIFSMVGGERIGRFPLGEQEMLVDIYRDGIGIGRYAWDWYLKNNHVIYEQHKVFQNKIYAPFQEALESIRTLPLDEGGVRLKRIKRRLDDAQTAFATPHQSHESSSSDSDSSVTKEAVAENQKNNLQKTRLVLHHLKRLHALLREHFPNDRDVIAQYITSHQQAWLEHWDETIAYGVRQNMEQTITDNSLTDWQSVATLLDAIPKSPKEQRKVAEAAEAKAKAQALVDRQARAAAEAAAAKAEAAAAKAEAEVARLKAALAEQKEIAGQEQRVAEKQAPKAGFFIVPKRPVPEPVNAEALEDNEDHLNKKTRKSPC
ncbi:MAG: hypothetical protein ACOVQX_02080 [Legionella sp.]